MGSNESVLACKEPSCLRIHCIRSKTIYRYSVRQLWLQPTLANLVITSPQSLQSDEGQIRGRSSALRTFGTIGDVSMVDDWKCEVYRSYSGGNTDIFSSNHLSRSPAPKRFIDRGDGCPVTRNTILGWADFSNRLALMGRLSRPLTRK
jgi:hypothetical protein